MQMKVMQWMQCYPVPVYPTLLRIRIMYHRHSITLNTLKHLLTFASTFSIPHRHTTSTGFTELTLHCTPDCNKCKINTMYNGSCYDCIWPVSYLQEASLCDAATPRLSGARASWSRCPWWGCPEGRRRRAGTFNHKNIWIPKNIFYQNLFAASAAGSRASVTASWRRWRTTTAWTTSPYSVR